MDELLERRPVVVVLAGPNGAGKSTFFEAHLRMCALPFVNADNLARELEAGAYEAAEIAEQVRHCLANSGESFVFETVFSDPVGAKVDFLHALATRGYTVVLCFIGLESVDLSDTRVAIRVAQGGHDVPREKIESRYARTFENLDRAIAKLPFIFILDNSVIGRPHRLIAKVQHQKLVYVTDKLPTWFLPFRSKLEAV